MSMAADEVLRLDERILVGIDVGESHFREFKSAYTRNAEGLVYPRNVKDVCRDVAETLVAFANADGGELFVGVEDDGTITGVPHKEELVESIKKAHFAYVHHDSPLPPPAIGDISNEAGRIVYFSISKSTARVHLTSDGRCLQRFDRENRPVAVERIMAAREEAISIEYDRAFVDGASLSDLDIDLLNHAAEAIQPGFSPEKLLQYLGLAEYGSVGLRYRKAALLLFAKDVSRWHPRCQVRIVRIRGTELGTGEKYNVSQDDLVSEVIPRLIEEAWEILRPHLARTRFQSTGLFRESIIYPELACREALVNAIAHRDYSREGNAIEILVFDDRMEFHSPGGLLSRITLEQLKSLSRVHETRNVLVARTLRELGHMREMGEGILRMFDAMRGSELVDPELTTDLGSFRVTLRYQSIFNRQDIEWLEGYREFDLAKDEQRVVLLGRDGHLLSTNEIIRVTGIVDTDDFRALSERLRRKGIVYNARPTASGGGRRREIGRFRVRPSRETEQFLGEMLEALKLIGPATSLSRESVSGLRSKLSASSPYRDRPDLSLQELGFIDSQRRFLPKAIGYVPELDDSTPSGSNRLVGLITTVKLLQYGFIKDDEGTVYFFHHTGFRHPINWDIVQLGQRVSFVAGPPNSPGHRATANDLQLI